MRHLAVLLIALAGLSLSATALAERDQPRGIDCKRAASKLEKLTCADEALREYDSRIAAAYDRALRTWDGAIAAYVRMDQREWLAELRTIERPDGEVDPPCELTDTGCIRNYVRSRVDALESGAYVHSGAYYRSDGMALLVYPRPANSYKLSLFKGSDPSQGTQSLESDQGIASRWQGPKVMVAGMGDGNGLPLPKGQSCELRLSTAAMAIDIVQAGKCGSGRYGGHYVRSFEHSLRYYEVSLE